MNGEIGRNSLVEFGGEVHNLRVMGDRILELIGRLDDDSTDLAEGAKYELMSVGLEALDQLIEAVPALESYGQLSAIEIFEHFGDARGANVLTTLLSSESLTVREWAAWTLIDLGSQESVPACRTPITGSG